MRALKTSLLALVVAGLLIAGNGFTGRRVMPVHAADTNPAVAIGCAASPPNWTDCTIVLNQAIVVGGSITLTLPVDSKASVCGYTPTSVGCLPYGNAIVISCPFSCEAGSQITISTLGGYGADLARQITAAVSGP